MIDVAFTRRDLRPTGVAVVIDVLRASTTAVAALAAGYERVIFVDSVEMALASRAAGRIIAGERHCVKPDGFDQGNSPAEAARCLGSELVLATTNGAPTTIAATQTADVVLLACLLNLGAVVSALRSESADVQLVCSGTDGAAALEDAYLAGRIAAALGEPLTDAARIALAVSSAYGSALDALAASADAAVLRRAGLGDDITVCARESVLDLVPVVSASPDGKTVARRSTAPVGAVRTNITLAA